MQERMSVSIIFFVIDKFLKVILLSPKYDLMLIRIILSYSVPAYMLNCFFYVLTLCIAV